MDQSLDDQVQIALFGFRDLNEPPIRDKVRCWMSDAVAVS